MEQGVNLQGEVALVTGGASGIGRAIVIALASSGARVVIADVQDVLAAEVAHELGDHRVRAIRTDVTDSRQADAAVRATVDAFDRLDILVNCAGFSTWKPVVELTDEQWRAVVDVVLHGTFHCSRAAARHMIAQGAGGRIVNIVSTVAAGPRAGSGPYAAAKSAVVSLTAVLAMELGRHRINVNCVGPGLTETPGVMKSDRAAYRENFVAQVPLGRLAHPDEIADAVIFLCSPAARFVSGQTLYVDGGYLAGKFLSRA